MDFRMLNSACDLVEDNADSSSDSTIKDEFSEASFSQGQDHNSEQHIDFSDMVMRNTSSGLTMKEYEEQLKKLTAENFNLKLRIYFVEERLSKVKGISDKEDLVKKIIELQVACEAKTKELESKQELIYEASKALDTLQLDHEEQIKNLKKEKEKEISELENKIEALEQALKETEKKISESNTNPPNTEEYEKQILDLENKLLNEMCRCRNLQEVVRENHVELEACHTKIENMESETEQRWARLEELNEELKSKDQELSSANFRIFKMDDELKSKEREEEIMKERLEEKNKTIDSLKASLSARDSTITILEAKCAKERSSSQSIQAKFDSMMFQNNRLKAEIDMLHSWLKRSNDSSSRNKKSSDDDIYKQKYDEFVKAVEEREEGYARRISELEIELNEYKQLCAKNKKLEDDHRKACAALRNFIKRSTDEKKERENFKAALEAKEEEIRELRAQIEMNLNTSKSPEMIVVDNKLSLAETGDNEEGNRCAEADNNNCCTDKEEQIELMRSNLQTKENMIAELEAKMLGCKCGVEGKIERIEELETDILILKYQLDDKRNEEDSVKEQLHNELEKKKSEIEKLNSELKKRNFNLQELVNKELWDKNRQIEKLEKRLNLFSERTEVEFRALNQQIVMRDQQLKILEDQYGDVGFTVKKSLSTVQDSPLNLSNTISDVSEGGDNAPENMNKFKAMLTDCLKEKKYLIRKVDELNEKLRNAPERDCESKTIRNLEVECAKAKEDAVKAEAYGKEVVEMCTLLTLRLEELAGFLDSLLTNRELLNGIGMKRRQDIKSAVERSLELSRHLNKSLIRKSCGDAMSVTYPDEENSLDLLSKTSEFYKSVDSLGISGHRDKIIAEQSAMIIRLREQLQMLNEEIKQRDIEISHCQGDQEPLMKTDDVPLNLISVSTQFSESVDEDRERPDAVEISRFEKQCQKVAVLDMKRKSSTAQMQDASESEAWSEPDRSVSLARMGHIEDGMLNMTLRSSKLHDSTEESSEETLNEKPRSSVKQSRSSESDRRKLQTKIRQLDEENENLRKDLELLRKEASEKQYVSNFQKNDEANLLEKLNKTISQLEESRVTCQGLKDKLSQALERSSASAEQLAKATSKIEELEDEIKALREELQNSNLESNQKSKKIEELKMKLEEIILESELRLIEAIKQKEAAEKKTLEVECRLKDAENMSKEVQSRVVEIEKKINETKKLKKETILQFKEAERNVDTAEKIMEKTERKSKEFQNYVDVMRIEMEEKIKDTERRVKRAEREKDDMEKQLSKLKKKLMEEEANKTEVEMKVKEGKQTIQSMEEKLKELEVAMDQCNEEAQRRIKEIQKKADSRIMELEHQIQEREWMRKNEAEKKMIEAEKISRELEIGFKRQLEDAEKRVIEAKEYAEFTIREAENEFRKQEGQLRQKVLDVSSEKDAAVAELSRQLDEARLEASELELEVTRLTNEKIHLEEELKRMLDKECALLKDTKEIKGKYEKSIHELENKLSRLTINKTELASRLEEIESTNINLATRISAIRGKETYTVDREYDGYSPLSSPVMPQNIFTNLFGDVDFGMSEINGNGHFNKSGRCDQGDQMVLGIQSMEAFAPPRRNMNSSPDLGIESDPGRFSSLEAQHQLNMDPILLTGRREESEVTRLENENAELRRRLVKTRQALEETLVQLSAANERKKQVERAICKQLHKTHHVLKRARVNFEGQDPD